MAEKFDGLREESKKKEENYERRSILILPHKELISGFGASSENVRSDQESDYGKKTETETVRNVKSGSVVIGTKKKVVFHVGNAKTGKMATCTIHEYCINDGTKYYIEPISRQRFGTKEEVEYFIETESSKTPISDSDSADASDDAEYDIDVIPNTAADNVIPELDVDVDVDVVIPESVEDVIYDSAHIDKLISDGWAFDPMNVPDEVKWSLVDPSTNHWVASIGDLPVDSKSTQNWMNYYFNGK